MIKKWIYNGSGHTLGLVALVLSITSSVVNAEADITDISYATAKGWQLDWQDEFDGNGIDESKWGWEQNCWGGGNNELQCYTDRRKNSLVEDGKLVIRAYKETYRGSAEPEEWGTSGTKTLPYTSARMRTKNKGDWKFGRIEVRAKLPAGQGIWPAIWMLPTDSKYGTWAASGEIDIVEAVNMKPEEPNKTVYGTIHYGKEWPNNVYSGETFTFNDSDPVKQFHTYAIEWADGEIRWYVDNHHYATQRASGWYTQIKDEQGDLYNVKGSAPFDQPFHLMLNVAVGGNWPGGPDRSTKFPVQMEVDYVRVYSCPKATASLRICATKSRRAKRNFGKQPPQIINIKYDPDFIKADVVDIYTDESQPPFTTDSYVASGKIDIKEVEEPGRGKVTQFSFNTDEGVAFWQGPIGFDFSKFKYLEFDVKRLVDPRKKGGLVMKMDCFYPCGTGDISFDKAPVGEWKHYRFALTDLVKHPGSTLNLTDVNTPLVIFPDWGNQNGVVLRVDNVRLLRRDQ